MRHVPRGTNGPFCEFDSRVVTMTTLRPFCADDLLRFNVVNLDVLTETVRGPGAGAGAG